MNKKIIYVDNAATTPVSKECIKQMLPFIENHFGNPSSIYSIAHITKNALENARQRIATCLNASPNEIYFTSCGSESDTWALTSAAKTEFSLHKKNKIITTNFEHHAVLNSCESLKNEGFEIINLPVDNEGLIKPEQIENAIDDKTAIVSVMAANNEIGTVLPIEQIANICKQKKVLFHCDAVQAVGHIPIDLQKIQASMLSISGHKIGAPKGIGLLFARNGTNLRNLICGGGQENNKRPGTENVAFAVGLACCMEQATANIEQNEAKIKKLQKFLLDGILNSIPNVRLNGSIKQRLNSNLNFSFEGIEGESLLLMLDSFGICASSGSACTSNSLEPSHVLLAIGLKPEIAHGSLRISLSANNTQQEMEYILKVLPKAVQKLRNMSPVWQS